MLRRKSFWIIALVLVLAAGGGGYYYYRHVSAQAQELAEEPTITTTTVRRGDLLITASGSGTLEPGVEISVGFQNGGVLSELLVEVGDQVDAGQILLSIT